MIRLLSTRKGKLIIGQATRFARREDGTVTLFGTMVFLMMILVGGIAIDIIRYETQRVQLQATVDRAVLAAASLNQTGDPEEVVEGYLEASGVERYRLRFGEVTNTASDRSLAVSAEVDINTLFMHFFGVRALTTPAYGQAEQTAENVEISLVLDISSSMLNTITGSSRTRIDALQEAAGNFVQTVLGADDTGLVSINVVPYGGMANPGHYVYEHLGGHVIDDSLSNHSDPLYNSPPSYYPHSHSFCPEFLPSQYTSADLIRGDASNPLDQVPHFMSFAIYDPAFNDWGWCPGENTRILYAENRLQVIQDHLDGMRLHDGTGTQMGLQWGLALLNPTSQPFFEHLVNMDVDAIVPRTLINPELDGDETIRQTFGVTEPLIFDDRFAERPADWDDESTQKYIVLVTDGQSSSQWRPEDPTLQRHEDTLTGTGNNNNWVTRSSGDNPYASGRNTAINQISTVCNQIPDSVTVFVVAFEVNGRAVSQARDCADEGNFFEAFGESLQRDLQSIAATINSLRLTQ